MLYTLYDWHQTALTPFRLAALAGQHIFSNPILPFADTRMVRSAAAACEMFERATRRYEKPAFGLDSTVIDGKTVGVAEEVALHDTFCRLLHFRRDVARDDPKVLLVAPMSGHFATLLRGTVAALLPDHDVYVTDWADAGQVPRLHGHFGLDDYVDHVVTYLQMLGPGASVIAVCQPSVPVMGAVALMAADDDPCQPAAMVLMGGPIDTRINPTEVNAFATRHSIHWFESAVITPVPYGYPGVGRNVYPGFLQLTGFMSMNIDRHFGAHMRMFNHLIKGDGDSADAHRRFYDEYMSVMDLTAEFYLETVEVVFQHHALPRGRWRSRDRLVEPAAIEKTALLTVEGELDDISAVGQTKAAHALCTGLPAARRAHHEQKNVGHYGIFNGRRWREAICPRVRDFIRANAA
jgi:poly(3-hydroxybutyrate) depolymerase